MLLGKSGGQLAIAPERMKQLGQGRNDAQLWMCLVVKFLCYKEQYCIGTWNVRSMNQGKLDVVKQAKVNINILGINELNWTGMGKFNSFYLPAMQEILGREDPLGKEMAAHSSILAWRIPGTEERDRLQFMGSQESDMT